MSASRTARVCVFFLIWITTIGFVAGCSLAGDLSPPPQIATQQAGQSELEPAQIQPTEVQVSVVPPSVQPDLIQGEALFIEKCAPCHGEDGMGTGPMASNLPEDIQPSPLGDADFARAALPSDWYQVVTIGNIERLMPGFSSLTETERWDVVAYALSLSYSEENLAQSSALYLEECAQCHGAQGEGETAGPLTEIGQIAGSSVDQLTQIITDGNSSGMPAFDTELSESQRRSLAVYLQSLAFTRGTGIQDGGPLVSGNNFATIRGEVLNQSTGEPVLEALAVTLHGFDEDAEVITREAVLDETGEYAFTDIEIASGRIFVVTAEYGGVLYGSEAAHLATDEVIFLPIDVYDTTFDAGGIRVDRLHVIFNVPLEGTLEVTELWIVSNLGDQSYANAEGEGAFQIHLPDGAGNLLFENGTLGDRFIRNEFGILDRFAVRPGVSSHEIVLSFEMPYDGRLEYEQPMEYPVDAVVVLLPEEGPEVTGSDLQDLGVQDLGGLAFRGYNAPALSTGDFLQLTVRGTPSDLAGGTSRTTELVVSLGALGAAIAVSGYWWYRRRVTGSAQAIEDDDETVMHDTDSLIDDIAALDDEFARGEIEEDEYQKERSILKMELLDLMQGDEVD